MTRRGLPATVPGGPDALEQSVSAGPGTRARGKSKKPLLIKFAPHDAVHGVTRETVRQLQSVLCLQSETAVIQYALAFLRVMLNPSYEPDDGPVPESMLKHIRATIVQEMTGGQSLFDGI